MNSHAAEIMTQPSFEKLAGCRIERLTSGAEHFMHDRWNCGWLNYLFGFALKTILLTLVAVFTYCRSSPTRALALDKTAPGGRS